MIIQSDNISMEASRRFSSTRASHTRYSVGKILSVKSTGLSRRDIHTVSRNDQPETNVSDKEKEPAGDAPNKTESEKEASGNTSGKNNLNNLIQQMSSAFNVQRATLQDNVDAFNRVRQQSVNYLMYILFGRGSIETTHSVPSSTAGKSNSFSQLLNQTVAKSDTSSGLVLRANGEYYSSFYYNEEEHTCFDAKGTAVTADGRSLPFHISLEMSRSFTEMAQGQVNFSQPKLCDPLVINLNNNATSVSDQKFFFDIDADGTKESVSMLNSGSGYLALDKNNDGVIGDGSELFGAQSGNGFQDLAAYDKDQNGWIDEADAIFAALRIWTKDANGRDQMLTLAQAGIGALYLGYEDTDFSLNSSEDNKVNGIIRKTGFFLYENGVSGTLQQLDLAK